MTSLTYLLLGIIIILLFYISTLKSQIKQQTYQIERLQTDSPIQTTTNLTRAEDLKTELRHLKTIGKPIMAIKVLREKTGMGIKEAKEFVDQL